MTTHRALLAAAAIVLSGATLGASAPRTAPKHATPAAAAASTRNAAPRDAAPQLQPPARVQVLLRQAAVLRAQNAAVSTAPNEPPRMPRARAVHGDDAGGSPRIDPTPPAQSADSGTTDQSATAPTVVPGPVTDAVAHICGNVTVCGVWWPGALGDREAYQSCMLHSTAAAAGDLDFGTSSAEYCSSLYGGDCDDAVPGSDLHELCSLVPGVAAQWTPDYAFSRIVTAGDCAHYKTVALPEKNVLGLRLDARPTDLGRPANGAAPQLTICTAKLYLRVTQ